MSDSMYNKTYPYYYNCHLCNNYASNFNISQYSILIPWCPKCYAKNLINVVKLSNNEKICHTCAFFGRKTVLLENDMIPINASPVSCIDCINKYGIEKINSNWKKYDKMEKHIFQKRFAINKNKITGNDLYVPNWHYYKDGHIYPLYNPNNYDTVQNQLMFPMNKSFSLFQEYRHPQLKK